MMEKLRNPKNVKLVSLFVAAIFVLGCFALSLTQSGMGGVASAAPSQSAIGVVNYQMVVGQSAEMAALRTTMQAEQAAAQKEFEEKSQAMTNENEKRMYFQQLRERLANKENELLEPILAKANAAIQKVADKKGLAVVVHKDTVAYGGLDITADVAKAMAETK